VDGHGAGHALAIRARAFRRPYQSQMTQILAVQTQDRRFELADGSGTDAVHGNPEYSYAVTQLVGDELADDPTGNLIGEGAAFTLGDGNDVVADLAGRLALTMLEIGGSDVESLMARFGAVQKQLADDAQLRWLGPHKGAIHLALASVTNAAFDLWARSRRQPLWELLLSLDDEALVNLIDFSWVEDYCNSDDARSLLQQERSGREIRSSILQSGYPGYDTSVGWFDYPDEQLAENAAAAAEAGFTAMKLKVGSADLQRDLRRLQLVKNAVPEHVKIMVDANQQWRWPQAKIACLELAQLGVYWIEEPTHPDDVLGHQRLAELIHPHGCMMAVGEHISNRVLFKNFMQANAVDIVQVDAMRVAGVSEFLLISMMARRAGLQLIPHVGDMGQLHQHLVLFNHIALGLPAAMLEHIPHLQSRFVDPAQVQNGVYQTPRCPGAGMALKTE
jgi:L-fuconate dehydratase